MLKDDIKKKVEQKCATYAGNGRCLLDRPCPFFSGENDSLPRCLYFEKSVLSEDDKLKAKYWNARGLTQWNGKQSVCKRCNNPYERKSNRVQYCETCNEEVKKETRRKRNQRYRRKSETH